MYTRIGWWKSWTCIYLNAHEYKTNEIRKLAVTMREKEMQKENKNVFNEKKKAIKLMNKVIFTYFCGEERSRNVLCASIGYKMKQNALKKSVPRFIQH